MKAKLLIGAAILAAFVAGAVAHNYVRPGFSAEQPRAYARSSPAQAAYVAPQPAETSYAQPAPAPQPVRRHRSLERQMLIVGGSAGAGSAIGAVAGGGKGAAIGAVSGGVAGLVYDLATRNR